MFVPIQKYKLDCIVFRYIRQIQSIQLAEQQDCFQSNKVIFKFNKVIYKFNITELLRETIYHIYGPFLDPTVTVFEFVPEVTALHLEAIHK
jgi:hypothetical protein